MTFTLALALLFTATLTAGNALALTRSEVIGRAKAWTNSRVPYSQSRKFQGYRSDCSGFVSYALELKKPGYTTVALSDKMLPVPKRDLKPGDVIVARGVHAVLFGGWVNAERTKYVAYEQSSSSGSVRRVTPYPYWKGAGRYAAKKHPGIKDGGSFAGGVPLRVKLTRKRSDFNGDGLSDIAFLYDGPSDTRSLWHFYSTGLSFKALNVWMGNAGAFDAKSAKMTSGDFNGDSIADSAFLYRNPDNSSSIWIFYSSRGGRSVKPVKAWTSQPGGFDWERIKMASGDFDGDGQDDLAFFHGSRDRRSTAWIFLSKKAGGFSPAKWWQGNPGTLAWGRTKMVPGDYNGDGRTDLAFLYNYARNTTEICIFTAKKGGGFSSSTWWRANPGKFSPDRIKMVSGYFNADNYADIAMFYDESNNSSSVITLYSNGGGTFNPKSRWTSTLGGFSWSQAKMMSGDFNADGLSDLTFLYGYSDGHSTAWMFDNNPATRLVPRAWWIGVAGTYNWDGAMSIDQGLTEDKINR